MELIAFVVFAVAAGVFTAVVGHVVVLMVGSRPPYVFQPHTEPESAPLARAAR
jgi:hypothetical protein